MMTTDTSDAYNNEAFMRTADGLVRICGECFRPYRSGDIIDWEDVHDEGGLRIFSAVEGGIQLYRLGLYQVTVEYEGQAPVFSYSTHYSDPKWSSFERRVYEKNEGYSTKGAVGSKVWCDANDVVVRLKVENGVLYHCRIIIQLLTE